MFKPTVAQILMYPGWWHVNTYQKHYRASSVS